MKAITFFHRILSGVGEGAGKKGTGGPRQIVVRPVSLSMVLIFVLDTVLTPLSYAKQYESVWTERRHPHNGTTPLQCAALISPPPISQLIPCQESSPLPTILPKPFRRTLSAASHGARIQRIWNSSNTNSPYVLLLQDVHLNTEAQANLAGVLERTLSLHPGLTLAVEGAEGPFNFGLLRSLGDDRFKRRIATIALSQNIISAPSYVGFLTSEPVQIIGVDDSAAYQQEQIVLRVTQAIQPDLLKYLEQKRAILEIQKSQILTNEQKMLDQALRRREQNSDALVETIFALSHISQSQDNELVIEQFLTTCRLEKQINFRLADSQKQTVLEKLLSQLSDKDKRVLFDWHTAYLANNRGLGEYMNIFRTLFDRYHVLLTQAPDFATYLQYVALADRIDVKKLLPAVQRLQDQALKTCRPNKTQWDLLKQSRILYLTERLIHFALTSEEWNEYKHEMPGTTLQMFDAERRRSLHNFERFYELADLRSDVMAERVSKIAFFQSHPVALIAGGFHTERLCQQLQAKNISYAVVQPLITHIDDDKGPSYLSVFTRDKTPIEKLLAGDKLYLAPPQPLVGRPDKLANANLMRLIVALVLFGKNIIDSRIQRTRISGRWNVTVKDVGTINATTDAFLPNNVKEIQRDDWPPFGMIHYVTQSAAVRESPWLSIAPSLLYGVFKWLSLPNAWARAIIIIAVVFVARHDHKTNGPRDFVQMAVRLSGSLLILTLSGWIFDPTLSCASFLEFSGLTTMFHAVWNAIMPQRFQLQIHPTIHVRAGQQEQLRQIQQELVQLARRSGFQRLSVDEQNALRVYLLRKHGVVPHGHLPTINMSPSLLEAIQDYEFKKLKDSGFTTIKIRQLEDRLRYVLSLYKKVPVESDPEETIVQWITDPHTIKKVRPSYVLTVYQGPDRSWPRLVTTRQFVNDVMQPFKISDRVKTNAARKLWATMEALAAIQKVVPGDPMASDLMMTFQKQWAAYRSFLLSETDLKHFSVLRKDLLFLEYRINQIESNQPIQFLINSSILHRSMREHWLELAEKEQWKQFRDASKMASDFLNRPASALTRVLNTTVLKAENRVDKQLLSSIVDQLNHALTSPRNTMLWESNPRLKDLVIVTLQQAEMLYAFVRGPTSNVGSIAPPPPPASLITPTPASKPLRPTGLKRETRQRIAFYSTLFLFWILIAYGTGITTNFLRWTDIAYIPYATTISLSQSPHFSFTNVTASFAVFEIVYRLIYSMVHKWGPGKPQDVRFLTRIYTGPQRNLDEPIEIERADGVEVDLTDKEHMQRAIEHRFLRYAIDISQTVIDPSVHKDPSKAPLDQRINVDLGVLTLAQLRHLYFILDKQDRVRKASSELERVQRKAATGQSTALSIWQLIFKEITTPFSLIAHMPLFLRDFFFETQIARWRYGVSGRFENHFAVAYDGSPAKTVIEKLKRTTDPSEQKILRDKLNKLYAPLDPTKIEFENRIRAAIQQVRSQRGTRILSSVVRQFVLNNIVIAGFVVYLIKRIPITVIGAVGGLFVSPIGFFIVVSVPLILVFINNLKNRKPRSWPIVFGSATLLVIVWLFRDALFSASLESWKEFYFPEFNALENPDSLLKDRNWWQRVGMSIRSFLTPVIRHINFSTKSVVSSFFTAIGLTLWQAFSKRWSIGKVLKSPIKIWRALWTDINKLGTWGLLYQQTKSMWLLGGEIAFAVETAGSVGHLIGGVEGETAFRGMINLLESEYDSAMSLVQDLQRGTVGRLMNLNPSVHHESGRNPNLSSDVPAMDWNIPFGGHEAVKDDDLDNAGPTKAVVSRPDPLTPFRTDLQKAIEHADGGFSLHSESGSQISFLYDTAITTQKMLTVGDLDKAVSLITRPWQTRSDVRVQTNSGVRTITAPVTGIDADTGRALEWKVDTGAILHDGLAALSVFRQLPRERRDGFEGKLIREKINRVTAYALAMRNAEGGFRQGPIGKSKDRHDQYLRSNLRFYDNFSTEHQWDAYAYFSELSRQSGNQIYQQIADNALAFAIKHNWDPTAHRFRAGFSNVSGKVTDNPLYPTDIQAWALSLVGIEKLTSFVLPGEEAPRISLHDIGALIKALDQQHAVKNGLGTILGYDYLANRQSVGVAGRPIISIEWTAQVLAAKLHVARYLKQHPELSGQLGLYSATLEAEVRTIAENLLLFHRGPHGGLYYAHNPDGSPAQHVPTGFGWNTQIGESLISNAYLAAVLSGFDPVKPNDNAFTFPQPPATVTAEKPVPRDLSPQVMTIEHVEDKAWISEKNLALRMTIARQMADQIANETNHVVEIPTVPTNEDGIPLKLTDSNGRELSQQEQNPRRIFLTDGNGKPLISLSEAIQPGSGYFHPSRRYFMNPHRTGLGYLLNSNTAVLRDISGRIVPKKGVFVRPEKDVHNSSWVHWRDADGNISIAMPTSKAAIPIDPLSHNDLYLGVDKARAEHMSDLQLENFDALTQKRISDRDAIAFVVDNDFKIVSTYKTFDDMKKTSLRCYVYGPIKNGLAQLEEYDPLVHPDWIADVVKTPKGQRVFFTLKAREAEAAKAQIDAAHLLSQAHTAWGLQAWIDDIAMPDVMTAIEIQNQNGDTQTVTVRNRLELEQAIRSLRVQGLKDTDQSILLNDSLEFPDDPGRHQIILNSGLHVTFTRFDHPAFPEIWLRLVQQALTPTSLNPEKVLRLKPGMAHPDLVNRDMAEAQLNAAQRAKWRISPSLPLPNGETLVRRWLIYIEDPNGQATRLIDNPIEAYRFLRDPNLLYEIPDGAGTRRVPYHLLPENPQVLSIYEPDTNNRIVIGSVWKDIENHLNANFRSQQNAQSGGQASARAIEMRVGIAAPIDQIAPSEVGMLNEQQAGQSFEQAFERARVTNPLRDAGILGRLTYDSLIKGAVKNGISVEEMYQREMRSMHYEMGLIPHVSNNTEFHALRYRQYLTLLRNNIRAAERARDQVSAHQWKLRYREAVETQSYIPWFESSPLYTYKGHITTAREHGFDLQQVFEYRWVFLGDAIRVVITPDAQSAQQQAAIESQQINVLEQIESARRQNGGVMIVNSGRVIPFDGQWTADQSAAEQTASYKKFRARIQVIEEQSIKNPARSLQNKLTEEKQRFQFLINAGAYIRPNGDLVQVIPSWEYARRVAQNLTSRYKPTEARRSLEDFLVQLRVNQAKAKNVKAVVTETDKTGHVRVITDLDQVISHTHRLEMLKADKTRAYQTEKDPSRKSQLASELQKMDWHIYEENGSTFVIKNFPGHDREQHDLFLARVARAHADANDNVHIYTLFDDNHRAWGTTETDDSGDGHGSFYKTTIASVRQYDPENKMTLVERRTYGSTQPPTKNRLGSLLTVRQDWVDTHERSVSHVSGHVEKDGSFIPLFITNDTLSNVPNEIDDVLESFTHPITDPTKLRRSDYLRALAPILDSSKLIGKIKDLANGVSWTNLFGQLSVESLGKVDSLVAHIRTKADRVIEVYGANGSTYRAVVDQTGRVLAKIEGQHSKDGFQPFRLIINQYDNAALSAVQIPSSSSLYDIQSGTQIGASKTLSSFEDYLRTGEVVYELVDHITHVVSREIKNTDGERVRTLSLKRVMGSDGTMAYVPFNLTVALYSYGIGQHGAWGLSDFDFTFVTDSHGNVIDPTTGAPLDVTDHALLVEKLKSNTLPYFEATRLVMKIGKGDNTRVIYDSVLRFDDSKHATVVTARRAKDADGHLIEQQLGAPDVHGRFRPQRITLNALNTHSGDFGRFKITDMSKTFTTHFLPAYNSQQPLILSAFDLGEPVFVEIFDREGRLREDFLILTGHANPIDLGKVLLQNDVGRIRVRQKQGHPLFELRSEETSWLPTTPEVQRAIVMAGATIPEAVDEQGRLHYYRESYAFNENGQRIVKDRFLDYVAEREWRHTQNLNDKSYGELTYDDARRATHGMVRDQAKHPSLLNKLEADNGPSEETYQQSISVQKNPYLPDLPTQIWQVNNLKNNKATTAGIQWLNMTGRKAVETTQHHNDVGEERYSVTYYVGDQDDVDFSLYPLRTGSNKLQLRFAAKENSESHMDLKDADFIYVHVEAGSHWMGQTFPWTLVVRDKSGHEVRVGRNSTIPFWNVDDPDNKLSLKDSTGHATAPLGLHATSAVVGKKFILAVPVQHLKERGHLDIGALDPIVYLETERSQNADDKVRVSKVMRAQRPPDQKISGEALQETAFSNALVLDPFRLDSDDHSQSAFYDGQSNEDGLIDIPIRDAAGRLLARMNIYVYPDAQTGRPIEKRVLVLFDQGAHPYPIGLIELPTSHINQSLSFAQLKVRPYAISRQGHEITVYETNPLMPASVPVVRVYDTSGLNPRRPVEISLGYGLDLKDTQSDIPNSAQGIRNNMFSLSLKWFQQILTRRPSTKLNPVAPIKMSDVHTAFNRLDGDLLKKIDQQINNEYEKLAVDQRPSSSRQDPVAATLSQSLLRVGLFTLVHVVGVNITGVFVTTFKNIKTIGVLSITAPLMFLGLLPIFSPIYDYFWSRWFAENRRPDPTPQRPLRSNQDLRVEAMTRYAKNVQGRLIRDKNMDVVDMSKEENRRKALLITGDEDIEGGFIQAAIDIYVTSYANLIHWRDADPEKRAQETEKHLRALDGFTRAVNKAMAREWGRGNSSARYKDMTPYQTASKTKILFTKAIKWLRVLEEDPDSSPKGKYNPQIWNELNKVLFIYHERLKTPDSFLNEFEKMQRALLQSDEQGNFLLDNDKAEQDHPEHTDVKIESKYMFNMDALRNKTKANHWSAVPALSIILARHVILRLIPVFAWSIITYGGSITSPGVPGATYLWMIVILFGLMSFVLGGFSESRAILNSSSPKTSYGVRVVPAVITLGTLLLLLSSGTLAFGGLAIASFLTIVMLMEIASLLSPRFFSFGDHRSLLGIATWITLRPAAYMAPRRHYALFAANEAVFIFTAVMLMTTIFFPWASAHLEMQEYLKTGLAVIHFALMLMLLHKALNYHVRILFTSFDLFKDWFSKPNIGEIDPHRKKVAISFVSLNSIRSQVFQRKTDSNTDVDARQAAIKDYEDALQFRLNYAPTREAFLMLFAAAAKDPRLSNKDRLRIHGAVESDNDEEIKVIFMEWLTLLWAKERQFEKTLFSVKQLWDPAMPKDLQFTAKDSAAPLTDQEKLYIEHVHHWMRALNETSGMILLNNSSLDVAFNMCDLAVSAQRRGHASKTVFYIVNNLSLRPNQSVHDKHEGDDYTEMGELRQRMYLAELLKYLSSDKNGENGAEAYVMKVHTAQGTKAGALNGPMLLPESFKDVGQSVIVDVNSTALNTDQFWDDQETMWNNPDVVAIVAQRNVPGRENSILDSEYVAEGGHYMSMRAAVPITGTGWGNTVRVQFWDNLALQADPDVKSVTFGSQEPKNLFEQLFGLYGMAYQYAGISEDYWQVAGLSREHVGQAAQRVSGHRAPRVLLSNTLWFRARASRGDLYNLAADKPRWVGGYFATMGDAAIQQAVEFGPYSLATRELRSTDGDSWSLLLFAFAYIAMMPWAVTLDFSPFIGTVIGLFFSGLLFNQASTGNSWLLNMRDRGAVSGTGYWLSTRIQDLWIWSYRENRNVLSSVTGFNVPSSAFDASKPGEGSNPFKVILENWHDTSLFRVVWKVVIILWKGRHNMKKESFWKKRIDVLSAPHSFFNSWMIGWLLLLSTLVAVRGQNADSLAMMILFLWYSMGGVAGPLAKAQKKGHVVGRYGWGDIAAKWVGFIAAYGLFIGLSVLGEKAAFAGSFRLSLMILGTIVSLSELYSIIQQAIENQHGQNRLKMERLLSEGGRGFTTAVMMLTLFYLAPVPSVIKITSFGGEPWFLERSILLSYLGVAIVVGLLLTFISKLIDVAQTRQLRDRYVRIRTILHELERSYDIPDWSVRSPIYSLLLEAYNNINRMAWRRADQSLKAAELLLPPLSAWGVNDFANKSSSQRKLPSQSSLLDKIFWQRRRAEMAVDKAA